MQPTNDPDAQPEKRSNTTPIQRKEGGVTGKGFTKGDKRINRKGRPKTFDKLRAMVVDVLNEELEIKGEHTTRLSLMLKSMTTGGNPADHRILLEYGFGKVPDELKATVKTDKVEAYDYNSAIAALAPRPDEDSDTPGEDQGAGDGAAMGQNSNGG